MTELCLYRAMRLALAVTVIGFGVAIVRTSTDMLSTIAHGSANGPAPHIPAR